MTPALGAFGVTATGGWKAWCIRKVTRSRVNHAVDFVGPKSFHYKGHDYVDEPAIVEANPSGAALAPLSKYPDAIWSDAPPDGKGQAVADAACRLIGTPYSWIDDACIGVADLFGWHVPQPFRDWLIDRLGWRGRLQCSQLVDTAARDTGWELWDDGRIPGDVSPQDLLAYIEAHAHVQA